jgi:parallel beta-helix repeat protein
MVWVMRGGLGGHAVYCLLVLILAIPMASAAPDDPAASAPAPLMAHDPILIDGDGAFTPANGVTSGTGTATDPFILENWTISARDRTGIEVRNTRVAFTIRNVVVVDGQDRSLRGIVWQNVSNARLEGSNLSRNYHGLEVAAGSNLTVADNRVEANAFFGIWIERSNETTLLRNTVANTSVQGIFIRDAFEVLVKDNDLVGNGVGMVVANSVEVRIYGNRIVGSVYYPADDTTGGNAWDGGYPQGGNFWSEYIGWDDCSGPAQNVCPDSDGIGDRQFEFAPSRWDWYPLLPVNPVNLLPVAAFDITGDPRSPGAYMTFNAAASHDPDGYPLRLYAWDFGDGMRIAGPDSLVVHSFSQVATFLVSLTVTDVRGGTGTATAAVAIEFPPGPEPLVLRPYDHPSAGFRLPIPEGWVVQEDVPVGNATIELILLGPLRGGTQTNILVETDEDSTVRETDAYLREAVDETIAGIRGANPHTSVDLMAGPTLRMIGDHAAATFKLQYGTGQLFQTIAIVVSEPHLRYWVLVLTTDGQSYSVMDEGFERMLAGFVITRAPPAQEPTTPVVTPTGFPLWLLWGGGIVALVLVGALAAAFLFRSRKPAYGPPGFSIPWSATAVPIASEMPPSTVPRFCPSCGEAIVVGARFCVRCGAAVPSSPATRSSDIGPTKP